MSVPKVVACWNCDRVATAVEGFEHGPAVAPEVGPDLESVDAENLRAALNLLGECADGFGDEANEAWSAVDAFMRLHGVPPTYEADGPPRGRSCWTCDGRRVPR